MMEADADPLAGYHPSNGANAKLMLCPSENWPSPYDSPDGRKWRYNANKFTQNNSELPRLSLANADFCLDLAEGGVGGKVQIWNCHGSGNPDYNNQVT